MNKTKKNLEVEKMLVLSTAHIKKETSDILETAAVDLDVLCSLGVYLKEGLGYYIYFNPEFLDGIPDDLRDCIDFTIENGCTILCLERDGQIVDDLPEYDWDEKVDQRYLVRYSGSTFVNACNSDEACEIALDNISIDDIHAEVWNKR